ncbi:ATP-grasp domain-containing protein [Streptomyces sp. G44]|uniref:ATP-grasp domain-containing protein n=1 Tax=Streptomyces sp. G44 TaxID=2807632 RepID=UPI0019612692|nr:ATP-grasp domain-containing protein [Streptomyces sp. G44]MBM7167728.1 ATP-grasp domain-containing protein [Streptomyces sp. G44]
MTQERTTVLHIGWMLRAVDALHRAGLNVTCVLQPGDLETARGAFPEMRTVVVPDQSNVEGILSGLARNALRVQDFDAVCSGLELCLTAAAVLSDLGGLTRGAALRAIAMRDKEVQKDLVRAVGVVTADCTSLATSDDVLPRHARFPVVVKPLSGSGALDTFRLERPEELRDFLATSAAKGPWLVEEFIPGTEYQVDGVVRGGEITFVSVARYLENIIDIHEGGLVGCTALLPQHHPDLYAKATDVARNALKALDHADGVFHIEVFDRSGEIVFGECGGRVGGGRTDEVVERTFGVNLHDEWVRGVLGRPSAVPAARAAESGAVHGDLHLHAPAGAVREAPSVDEVLARPGVAYAEVRIAPGQTMPDVTAASYLRAGVVVLSGADDTEVEDRSKELAAWFANRVVLEPQEPSGGA